MIENGFIFYIEISEGNHLSYAVQWFIFSLGLGTAYVLYVHKQTQKSDTL